MSDDKKRDRALQRRVRERQAKTGESYQAAWRQLTGTDAPSPDETPDEPPLVTKVAIGAEGLTTYQGVATEEDSLYEEDSPFSSSRRSMPLHLPRVPPHQPTRVATRAKDGAVDVDGIHISSVGTAGGSADWIVNDIEIDGHSQLAHKDLPGALFGPSGVAAARRAMTQLSLKGFDPVERDRELVLIVTYVGPNPEGVPFFAVVMGKKPPQRPTLITITTKSPLPLLTKGTITARVQNAPFQLERIEISGEDTPGGVADWIVNDLRINGRSQFVQSGDVPADLFATDAIHGFIKKELCEAGNAIEIDVTYIGLNENGAVFAASLEGTVTRDDYSVPPPNLNVLVETSGQGPGDIVIASCNWRAPASDNRTR